LSVATNRARSIGLEVKPRAAQSVGARRDVSNVELRVGRRRRECRIDEQAADVDGGAVAGGGDLQPALDRLGAFDQGLDVGQLALGQRADALARVMPVLLGSCELADLLQGEPRALCDVDDAQAVQDVLAIAALAAAALGLRENPDVLVVADVRCAQPGAGGDLPDGQRRLGGGRDGFPLTSSRVEGAGYRT
jgi:hypothetical protein